LTPSTGSSRFRIDEPTAEHEAAHAAATQETSMAHDSDDDATLPDFQPRFTTFTQRLELDRTLDGLDADEVAVLGRIAKRLAMGRTSYGPLRIELDRRAFRKEAREEVEDALVYFAIEWLLSETKEVR
jgi:hypothetical protein